jgi:hypothetical protein
MWGFVFLGIFPDICDRVILYVTIHAKYSFVGPGFKPRTIQHNLSMGLGFDSQAQLLVSGP